MRPKDVKIVAIPQIDERSLIKVGDGYVLTIHPTWLEQYALAEGDNVIQILDEEEKRILIVPWNKEREEKIKKKVGEERVNVNKIMKFGNSWGVYVRTGWVEKLKLAEGDKLLALSNYGMSFERFTIEKKKEFHEKFKVMEEWMI
ncbi:MAG: hypothetical protein QXI58_02620 [Candidatus Micrarchaeia archaeon]